MLDLKFVRSNPQVVMNALAKRGGKISLDAFLSLDAERRSILSQVEEMKSRRNTASKQVGLMKKSGEDATALMEETRKLGDEIAALDKRLTEVEDALTDQLLPHSQISHILLCRMGRMICQTSSSAAGGPLQNLSLNRKIIGISVRI